MKKQLQLQERDVQALAEIGEVGLLDTPLVHERHYANVTLRRCQQRMREVEACGLTHAVHLNVWFGQRGGGPIPTIHCLTERGAAAVESITGQRPRRVMRSDPAPETWHHRLAVVRGRLAFDDGCRLAGLAMPEWFMEQDRRDDADPKEPPSRRRVLYHEFTVGKKRFTCQPDAACLLSVPRDMERPAAGTTPLVAYWEFDRSRERTGQTLNKCPGYAALIERRDYRRYWSLGDQEAVRVFWVCLSQQRIDSLSQAMRDDPIARCFRFTTAGEMRPDTALVAPIWQTIDGQRREILRLPAVSNSLTAEPLGHPAAHLPPHQGP
jgi:hypothetical protein